MRRDSRDEKWKFMKITVHHRDKEQCRLLHALSIHEAALLIKKAGKFMKQLDVAHYRSVASAPEYCYDPNNAVLLNRYSHSMLDSNRDPITGVPISNQQVEDWWQKILKYNTKQYNYLQNHKMFSKQFYFPDELEENYE